MIDADALERDIVNKNITSFDSILDIIDQQPTIPCDTCQEFDCYGCKERMNIGIE